MSKEANIAILTKFATAVNTGNFELFKEAVAIDNVDHDPAPGQVPGPKAIACIFRRCGPPSRI